MGKSLKNAISPDDIYATYGADTLRLYEMAMGPLDADRPWRTNDIIGVHRPSLPSCREAPAPQ
jgi:leucyl-tRNA synthetase